MNRFLIAQHVVAHGADEISDSREFCPGNIDDPSEADRELSDLSVDATDAAIERKEVKALHDDWSYRHEVLASLVLYGQEADGARAGLPQANRRVSGRPRS